jgi:high-affinity K+ transport system ATPase subunit B
MKRTFIAGLAIGCFTLVSAWAAEDGKPLSAEQQQQRDAVIQKYDANKDGVLDKSEMKQLSKQDKKTLARTGGVGTAKKGASEASGAPEKAAKAKPADKAPDVDKPEKAPQPTHERGDKAQGNK